MPATPAGKQLAWLLDASRALPIDPATVKGHFDAAFLAQVRPTKINQILTAVTPPGGLEVTSIVPGSRPSHLVAVVESGEGKLQLSLATQPEGKIEGLLITPASTPNPARTSWSELDERLTAVAPKVGMVIAEVGAYGACTTIHAVHATRAAPLASMFKLYVLGAVAQQIESGTLRWNQQLTITSQIKSLPTGVLQNRPDGSTVTVQDAATKMVSISDNTAADLLAATVGRGAIESMQHTLGSANSARNVPFLRTRELSILKGTDYPKYRNAYLALSPTARLAYLNHTIDRIPLNTVNSWQQPRDITTLEWYASPQDVCRALAGLDQMARTPALNPLTAIMSANDGGLHLNTRDWSGMWFKAGSEPGVLTLGWLARSTTGRTYATVLMTANPDKPLNEATAPELLALARGAFSLATG
ncbi:serine hydrolase [Arthrobacter livingstonensis]|uniref:serine hydrolase n=1 Tax=Arthrobacter livingstonensis TaxID=670078 RepID=UPI0011B54E12|nr:serine hydrolase [Arthrobacter livingstonensis]